jgi:protein-tyrosine phosphatase
MIDIHTHILPMVDDGASCFDEALDMAAIAVESGVQALVATPHSNHDVGFVNYESEHQIELFEKLCTLLRQAKIPLQLYRGMENWASVDIVQKLDYGKLLTLNATRYTLVEFAFDEEPWWIEAILKEMLLGGYIPIIAHPERYFCIHEAPNHLYEWRIMGALAQMNKESILGRLGRHTAEAAELLLKHNLVNCVASDAHHAYARTTDMAALNRYLEKNFSQGYRDMLMKDNPRAVLEGRVLNMVGSFRAV